MTEFLARNEVEELLEAHDTIVRNFFPETESDIALQNEESVYKTNINQDPNIRIIRIEKTNEPLVSVYCILRKKIQKKNTLFIEHVITGRYGEK